MAAKPKVDWDAMEAPYSANIKSLRILGEEFGCSEGAIRKKAIERGWTRDLNAKINAKAQELVRKEEVRSMVRSELPTEKEQIEVGAMLQKDVILSHRKAIRRGRDLIARLFDELEYQCGHPQELAELGVKLRDPEAHRDRLNEVYMRVISFGDRVESAKKLTEALRIQIALEREAFGIESLNTMPGMEGNVTNIGITFVAPPSRLNSTIETHQEGRRAIQIM